MLIGLIKLISWQWYLNKQPVYSTIHLINHSPNQLFAQFYIFGVIKNQHQNVKN